jgi:3-hydroxyisobutyrate dehydrogenase
MAKVAVIGLGNMGGPMAANLVKAGHTVHGVDLLPDNAAAAAKRGVKIEKTSVDAAKGADLVLTMLPAGKHVLDVYRTDGFLTAPKKGASIIDCSTIDVASAREAHALASKAGLLSLDSPVSGGVTGAEAATLTLMSGGSQKAFDAAQPILAAVCKKNVHCGDAGAGQAAKICNNMLLAISMIGVGEAFTLAEKLGLSHKALFDVASTSSGQCWSLTTYCPVPGPVPTSPANNGYKPGFASALMVKDLSLAQDAARSVGAATPLGAEALQLYQLFVNSGQAGVDFSGIINMLRGNAKA